MGYLSIRKNILGIICLLITAAIVNAGLWPFNFSPENKVRWLQDQNGVQFYGQAMIFTQLPEPNSQHPAPNTLPPFSIELWLQPATEDRPHIGQIFSFVDERGSESFFFGQWKTHLILGKGIHRKKNYREIGIRSVLKKSEKRFVAITSGDDGTRIYVDGIHQKSSPRFHLFSTNEKPSGKIILGNSPTGIGNWTGNILGLAIYNRVLTEHEVSIHSHRPKKSGEEGLVALYPFDERFGNLAHDHVGSHHLIIPSKFEALQKIILAPPWKDFRLNRSSLTDILTNILGFIPFGFFSSAYLWMRKPRSIFRLYFLSMIIAGCLSLSIELIQVYLPTRSSQLMDVMMNILGAVVGAVLFIKYGK